MGWLRIERLEPDFAGWADILALIHRAFAYMDGRIDPPSSAHRLTLDGLKAKAGKEIAFAAYDDDRLVGCAFVELRDGHAYLGKLAVDPAAENGGIGRLLVEAAESQTRRVGLPALELQTRVELTDNQRTFQRFGFREIGRTAHPGFDRPTSVTMRKDLA
ncbi:MAG: GNAT family N-acetyltransferase [Rhizobiaceae bacterium]